MMEQRQGHSYGYESSSNPAFNALLRTGLGPLQQRDADYTSQLEPDADADAPYMGIRIKTREAGKPPARQEG